MDYILSTCTPSDLSKEYYDKYEIKHLGFHYVVNGKSYTDDLGGTMTISEFYQYIRKGADTSTSQVSVGEYVDHFRALLKEGKDILQCSFQSRITGLIHFNMKSHIICAFSILTLTC